ncbi:hypothetical protein BDA99DRAFT_564247 [Phascolomyces articulosus]|uniref:Uncharacterized protein n=1 Tax=Phascolomyces articulosus TaxID=60185 RepID=A0AAD5JQH3_9FUNG|nr:hypothetical protein BDA99DRAFT_564247 [Phascolomyces articulosus]
MRNVLGCYATHYYQPQDSPVMQARHPGVHVHDYSLPVIKKYVDAANGTKERYKAIGIYFLGSTFNKDLVSDDPGEILSSVFGGVYNDAKEFIIQ